MGKHSGNTETGSKVFGVMGERPVTEQVKQDVQMIDKAFEAKDKPASGPVAQ